MEKNLREIADLIGGELAGDDGILISGLSNIPLSRAGDLTFAVSPHLDAAKICAASAVLIPFDTADFPSSPSYWSCSRPSLKYPSA